jgi:hypothetical protein
MNKNTPSHAEIGLAARTCTVIHLMFATHSALPPSRLPNPRITPLSRLLSADGAAATHAIIHLLDNGTSLERKTQAAATVQPQ